MRRTPSILFERNPENVTWARSWHETVTWATIFLHDYFQITDLNI